VSRTTYADLFAVISPSVGTFTVTIASPGVFTLNSHGFVAGDAVYFTTTGALPTGLSANTIYYIIAAGLTTNAFEVSATLGGAAINTSGSQSGTHTCRYCPYGLGNGSTTFNIPDLRQRVPVGRLAADADMGYVGQTGGAKTNTLTLGNLPSSHSYRSGNGNNDTRNSGAPDNFYGAFAAGSDTPHNNLQPYITMNYIIRGAY
jgi:microcystin-dependent protein